ncbi:MAG: inorganic phosphate transporter, partial [Deltaproteobacteria bacterium]|nr:inorganic phosphate transporter [Deltaproteobacteria bacterium]
AGLALSFANGANDNFKGVATLFGSGTTSFRRALLWATLTTGLGSLLALLLAHGLLDAFSGKGLVPVAVVASDAFRLAVGVGAGATVLLATRLGMPISTTHSLVGALVGAGVVIAPGELGFTALGRLMIPLLTSPILAIALAAALYPVLRRARQRLGVSAQTCVCVGNREVAMMPGSLSLAVAMSRVSLPALELGEEASCHTRYSGRVFGLNARRVLDAAHYLSGGLVGFARGLNDTPKIAALLLVGGVLSPWLAVAGVALLMALGGLAAARRVAETLSHGVTRMNAGQGFTANLTTGVLVLGASRLGLPVSTTHVSVGALFGIGAATGGARKKTILKILAAWVITLPMAAGIAALTAALLR